MTYHPLSRHLKQLIIKDDSFKLTYSVFTALYDSIICVHSTIKLNAKFDF